MHLTLAAALLLASLLTPTVSAAPTGIMSGLENVPDCAQLCFVSGAVAAGCMPTEFTCICNDPGLQSSTQTCISASCNPEDLANAIQVAAKICGESAGMGLTVSPPEGATAAGGA